MTAGTSILKIDVVTAGSRTRRGDDAAFVAVHSREHTGWYGPVGDDVAAYVEDVLSDAVTGEPAIEHEALHAALVQPAAGARTTTAASWAIGAVDCAAWDLHGQLTGLPVAGLMSPSAVRTVPLYASWLSLDLGRPDSLDAVSRTTHGGWLFTKWGLRRGALAGDRAAEAARLSATVRRATAAAGEALALDAVFTWDVALATCFAEQVDPRAMRWIEDPLPESDIESYREVPESLPLAVGERLLITSDTRAVLAQRPRAFTLDVVGCGGLTRAIDLTASASAAGIPVYPHGRSFLAGVHLAAAFPAAVGAVEYRLQWEPARQQLYRQPRLPQGGTVTVPEAPGLGTTPRSR